MPANELGCQLGPGDDLDEGCEPGDETAVVDEAVVVEGLQVWRTEAAEQAGPSVDRGIEQARARDQHAGRERQGLHTERSWHATVLGALYIIFKRFHVVSTEQPQGSEGPACVGLAAGAELAA